MIVGLGLDVIELRRIRKSWERFGARFAVRFLHEDERATLPQGDPVTFLAGRFAAKEAASKALGTGFQQNIHWQDIRIGNNGLGAPTLTLHNGAKNCMDSLGAARAHLTISHSTDTAAAVVILEQ